MEIRKEKEKDEQDMKRKIIPVLVAIILIIMIGAGALLSVLIEKYSYSKERADLDAWFQVEGDQLGVIIQDEMVEAKALLRNGSCYFDLDTVHQYFNEGFYADRTEKLLLYTTAVELTSVPLGGTTVSSRMSVDGEAQSEELSYVPAFEENDIVYVAAEYIKRYTNCSVELFDRHVQVYTQWGTKVMDTVKKDTAVRIRGGVKSPILCDLEKGAEVEILEKMDDWSKVKTADSMIGYVENKLLVLSGEGQSVQEMPVTDYAEPEYTSLPVEGKVCLGWHSIGGVNGNTTLESMAAGANGLKIIAPTWFSLNDEAGNFRSFGEKSYVDRAHGLGLEVWGVWDDFNYNNETGSSVSVYQVLAATSSRQRLAANIVSTAKELGLDGVNIDFEKINSDSGVHYVQFIRELSVECRLNGLTLSIDNYVPYDYRDYYRLDIQGMVADYVIIMGYDEHWHGSKDPGSVASIGYVNGGISRALEEVPADKLVNALPFYTILWKTDGAAVTDEYLTLNNSTDFLNRMNVTPQWDEETCQNYAEWTSGSVTYQIWLEDEDSIAAKLSVMSSQDIAGVAVWRLGYGTESVWNLIRGYLGQ